MRRLATLSMAAAVLIWAPSFGWGASLLFRDSSGYLDFIPGLDHVGLEIDGFVWESHPGYDYPGIIPRAWDPDDSRFMLVLAKSGVQRQHSRGSFRWNSASPGASTTPAGGFLEIAIDPALASEMDFQIFLESGAGYPSVTNPFAFASSQQKGAGGAFTCVGLMEYAAEAAGLNCGQGFIPNMLEVVPLTPQMLYWAASNPSLGGLACLPERVDRWISGFFDPVDFVVTDPLGRRVGYTAATGRLDEVPGALYTGDSTETESLVILEPIPGVYHIELVGLEADAAVDLRNGLGASVFSFDGFLSLGETVAGSFSLIENSISADFDSDDDVDGDDLEIWSGGFGLVDGAMREQGDADMDGDVDGSDFLIWQRQLGVGSAIAELLVAVPEPRALGVVFSASLLIVARVGKRKRLQ